MRNVRNILIGTVLSALLVGIIVSCGGGGGGGDAAVPTYTVAGNITGATGTVVLKLNGGSDTPMAAAGAFTFPTGLPAGSTYNVQVAAPNQRCTVTSGAGTMGAANISNVAIACGAQTTQIVIRSAVLNGAQEGSRSTATGVGGVIVDPTNTDVNGNILITGGITFSGVTATAHHIHQTLLGDPTGNGGIIIGLTAASDGQTAIVPADSRLTPTQYTALLAGELYFNVHSNNPLCGPVATPTACTGGEIRGQINAQGGVLAGAAAMNFAQEVVAAADVNCTSSTATGQGTLIVDRATRTILISYMTHDVVNVSASHIHTSPTGPGSNGGVIIGFTTGSALSFPAVFGAQMTPQNITDFLANYLYFNIHSNPKCPGGEIRGNITALQ